MGWTQVGPAIAQNDNGALVRPDGRDRIVHVQGELTAEIEAEFGGPFVIVYADSVRSAATGFEESRGADWRATVLGEVLEALTCLGCDYETR